LDSLAADSTFHGLESVNRNRHEKGALYGLAETNNSLGMSNWRVAFLQSIHSDLLCDHWLRSTARMWQLPSLPPEVHRSQSIRQMRVGHQNRNGTLYIRLAADKGRLCKSRRKIVHRWHFGHKRGSC